MGERSLKSASCSQGAPRNQKAVNRVKSAVYQKSRQSAMDRCETAALKRVVWPMVQLVRTPPPLPPVTPRFADLGEVGRVPEGAPVGDGSLRNGGFEAGCVADGPVGQHAAATAAGDAQLGGVHPTARNEFVDARHEVRSEE